jgi:hypothetical protein
MVIVRPRSSVRLDVLRAVLPLPELLLDDCDELLTEERDETEPLLDTLLLAEDRPPPGRGAGVPGDSACFDHAVFALDGDAARSVGGDPDHAARARCRCGRGAREPSSPGGLSRRVLDAWPPPFE